MTAAHSLYLWPLPTCALPAVPGQCFCPSPLNVTVPVARCHHLYTITMAAHHPHHCHTAWQVLQQQFWAQSHGGPAVPPPSLGMYGYLLSLSTCGLWGSWELAGSERTGPCPRRPLLHPGAPAGPCSTRPLQAAPCHAHHSKLPEATVTLFERAWNSIGTSELPGA